MAYSIYTVIVTGVLILNIFLAIALIFLERRDPSSTWAWILILFFIPILGFGIYLLFGRKLRKKTLFRWEGKNQIGIDKLIDFQMEAIEDSSFDFRLDDASNFKELIIMHLHNNHAVLTQDNKVDIFVDGRKKFDALLEDIENAKNHIHIQYYILRLDNLGKEIYQALVAKAKQGVKAVSYTHLTLPTITAV